MKKLFTERHGETKPRVSETLNDPTRRGLLTLVSTRISQEWFGLSFPEKCDDGYAYAGTDFTNLKNTMDGYGLLWPMSKIDKDALPSDGQIFDVLVCLRIHSGGPKPPLS